MDTTTSSSTKLSPSQCRYRGIVPGFSFPRRGRDDLRVVRLNAVAGAPHFIYPALRLCASARAKALYGALIPRGRDDLRPVRLNTSSRQQLSGLLSSPSGFSPVRLNTSTPQQLSGLLSPPSGFSPVSPVRLNALTLAPCLRASV